MAIAIACGACGHVANVADSMAGRRVKCPGCGAPVSVDTPPSASPSPSAPSGKAPWIVGLVLLLLGGLFGGIGYHLVSKAAASKTWPVAEGVIERSTVVEREEREDGRTKIMYSADIVYRYSVEGRSYKSTSITPGGMTSSSNIRSWAEADAARYPVGRKADVRFNPADPSDACLETRAGAGPWIFLGAGVAVGLGGIALLGWKIRSCFR